MSEKAKVGIARNALEHGRCRLDDAADATDRAGLSARADALGRPQYDAERCYQLGWVPRDLVLETALAYARRMPYLALRKVRNIKQSLYRGYYMEMEPMVAQQFGNAIEQNLQGMNDSIEGPRAFSEKRPPNFTDT